jgi:hypothetical protein
MERYNQIFNKEEKEKVEEAFTAMTPEEKEQKVKDILDRLKDEDFGNIEQRNAFGSMMMALARASNKDKNSEARQFIKEIGKVFSNWSNGNFNKEKE